MCAIHQPNFFPWQGYFDKIARADVFVVLDRVSYPKSGSSMSSWCNRVRINVGGTPTWVSCPVIREPGVQPIDSVRINDARPWRGELRSLLTSSYSDAPAFRATYGLIDDLLRYDTDNLAAFNVNALRALSAHLGIATEWVLQSALPAIDKTATERLVALCQAVGADTYLCGGGSSGYLDEGAFERAGVALAYQNFVEPPHGDADRFLPGLSIIDRLMHTTP